MHKTKNRKQIIQVTFDWCKAQAHNFPAWHQLNFILQIRFSPPLHCIAIHYVRIWAIVLQVCLEESEGRPDGVTVSVYWSLVRSWSGIQI